MDEYAIAMEGVTKRYPTFTLDNVTLKVPRGSIMGLIGENGAGKTTTLKALLGILRPDAGDISLLGAQDPAAMVQAKQRIGVVLDEGFFPDVCTAMNIASVCRRVYTNWRQSEFEKWLERLSLPPRKKYKELSKGMKTKLAISVALSHGAELLVLDEATGGLDPVIRAEMLDVFLEFLQDERHAILFSTHITTDLQRVADSITFLHEGRVILQRDKDALLEDYGVLKCGRQAFDALDPKEVAGSRSSAVGYEVLIKNRAGYARTHPDAVIDPATLDDIMLFTIRGMKK